MVLEEISSEEFQDGHRGGGYLGYRNGTILAILNLCVTVMLPISFGRRCRLKNFKMVAMDIGTEQFRNNPSNSESLCRSDASNKVSAQS